MAAFTGTPVSATPYAAQVGDNKADRKDVEAILKLAPFTYTHAAGAGTGEINLVRLPAGKIRVYPQLSRIAISAGGTSSTLDLGHRAFTNADGTAVAEDHDEWIADHDFAGGALAEAFMSGITAATLETDAEYDTVDGLTIFATVADGNIEDGDTIDGYIAYTVVN